MATKRPDTSNWRTGNSTTHPEHVSEFLERHRITEETPIAVQLPPPTMALVVRPHRFSNPFRVRQQLQRQAGFALLLEMLIICCIMVTLAAASLPSLTQIHFDQQQNDAKDRIRMVGRAEAAAAICAGTQGCVIPPGVTALIPAASNSLTTGGYTFSMAADGITFTASPINQRSGQTTFSVSADDVVMCGGTPCKF